MRAERQQGGIAYETPFARRTVPGAAGGPDALLLLLEITGLGYIKTPVLEFTVMQVPVILGAIILGPGAGALLGGVFGLTSFWECFGKSAFGMQLLAINPWATAVVCIVPRLLMGLCCGLIFRALAAKPRKLLPFAAASLSGALLNTVFFMSALLLFFGATPYLVGLRASLGGKSILGFVAAMVGVQGVLEAVICGVLGTAIAKAVFIAVKKGGNATGEKM